MLGMEPGAVGSRGKNANHCAMLPPLPEDALVFGLSRASIRISKTQLKVALLSLNAFISEVRRRIWTRVFWNLRLALCSLSHRHLLQEKHEWRHRLFFQAEDFAAFQKNDFHCWKNSFSESSWNFRDEWQRHKIQFASDPWKKIFFGGN